MENPQDLRILKTNIALKKALIELMGTIGFDKITVQNLTKQAMVSRTTFYLHYQDKYDLLDKVVEEMFFDIQKMVAPLIKETLTTHDFKYISEYLAQNIYTYIYENQQFFKLVLSEKGNPSSINKFHDTIKSTLFLYFNESNFKIPSNYVITIIASVQTGLIKEWINTGLKETPDQLATIAIAILSDLPSKVLDLDKG